MESDKKISLVEIIIMFLLVGAAWLFNIFADIMEFIPVIGQAIGGMDFIIDLIVGAIVQGWLIFKGGIGFRPMLTSLVGGILNLVPFLNALPIEMVSLAAAIIMINNPKLKKIAEIKSGKISNTLSS